MSTFTIGLIGIGILLLLLVLRMPIGFAMGVVGFAGMIYLRSFSASLGLLGTVTFRTFADYTMSVIPLFILMGLFCFYAGLSKDLYEAFHSWIGKIRGGLAMATVAACAGFAAVSGSTAATAATIGKIVLPEMRRYKYDDRLATGSIAAGGTLGILIPPSIPIILYAIITEQSIGRLFLAGVIPGLLSAASYIVTIYIMCKLNPNMGPPGPSTTLKHKMTSLKNTWLILLLFLIIIGGIYIGLFSPAEAAGIGAFCAFAFALLRKRLSWGDFKASLSETGKTTGMIFTILLGAMIFGYFLSMSRIPFELASIVTDLPLSPYIILALILLVYMLLGCVMDALAIMLIVTPIFFPIILALGFNPIWFGILVIRVSEIGLITPPVGLNVYIIKGVAKDVPTGTIFRGIFPFLLADIVHIALLIALPQLTLFLPGLMG